jgi:hypothetical protein
VVSDGHPYRDPERRLRGLDRSRGRAGEVRPGRAASGRQQSDKSREREGSALAFRKASFLLIMVG